MCARYERVSFAYAEKVARRLLPNILPLYHRYLSCLWNG
jgi:hypothetical protein